MNGLSIKKWLPAIVFVGVSSQAKTQIAGVFANKDICKTKVCLHGHFKKGETIYLLSKEKEETCKAKVGKQFRADYQPGNFDASEVSSLKKCKISPEKIFLAVWRRPNLKYKIYNIEDLTGEGLSLADASLKKDKIFKRAWRREVFHKSADRDQKVYSIEDYKKLEPQGYLVKLPPQEKSHLQILKHRFTDGGNDGIYFAYFNKSWSPVSTTFTLGRPFVFTINGKVFISDTVTCQMNCGYQDQEVYEFNGRIFKLIYNNADFST